MQLHELQKAFGAALLTRNESAIAPLVQADGIEVAQRLSVYRVNVFGAIGGALKETFPAVLALVGDAFFEQMAAHFIQHQPPRAACLLWYGGDFPDFIATYAAAASLPYLADVARFEWAWHHAQYAEVEAPLDPAWLDAQEEEALEGLVLHLRQGVALVSSVYPVEAIWRYARNPDHEAIPEVAAQQRQHWLVWRPQREAQVKPLDASTYAALRLLEAGATLDALVAADAQQKPETEGAELLAMLFEFLLVRDPRHSNAHAQGVLP